MTVEEMEANNTEQWACHKGGQGSQRKVIKGVSRVINLLFNTADNCVQFQGSSHRIHSRQILTGAGNAQTFAPPITSHQCSILSPIIRGQYNGFTYGKYQQTQVHLTARTKNNKKKVIIFGEEYKLWSVSLYNQFQTPVASPHSGLNMLSSILFSYTLYLR